MRARYQTSDVPGSARCIPRVGHAVGLGQPGVSDRATARGCGPEPVRDGGSPEGRWWCFQAATYCPRPLPRPAGGGRAAGGVGRDYGAAVAARPASRGSATAARSAAAVSGSHDHAATRARSPTTRVRSLARVRVIQPAGTNPSATVYRRQPRPGRSAGDRGWRGPCPAGATARYDAPHAGAGTASAATPDPIRSPWPASPAEGWGGRPGTRGWTCPLSGPHPPAAAHPSRRPRPARRARVTVTQCRPPP